VAAEYGWSPRHVEAQLTDELLVLLLDGATDRLDARFRQAIETTRAGTIFAHDEKQHGRWVRSAAPKRNALSGDALEQAIRGIAAMFPGNVQRVTA
jgi:hypothetical protein